jgi:hypothetical protein
MSSPWKQKSKRRLNEFGKELRALHQTADLRSNKR